MGIAKDLWFTLNSPDESFHVEQTPNHTEETQPKAPSPWSRFWQLTKSCNRLIGCSFKVLWFSLLHLSVLSMWSQNQYYSSLLKHEEPQFLWPAKPHGHKQESTCSSVNWQEPVGFFPQLCTPSARELTNYWKITWEKRLQKEKFCNKCS